MSRIIFLGALLALAVSSAANAGEIFGGLYVHDVDTPLSIGGVEGVGEVLGYRGVPTLASWGPIRIPGVKWGLVAKIDAQGQVGDRQEEVAPRICDDCIGLAGCIILQMVGDRIEERPASQLDPERVSAAVARLITKVAAGELPRSTTKVDVPEWPFRCNFCWADQADVATLVSGPRVFICERCVEDAVAFVHQLPR